MFRLMVNRDLLNKGFRQVSDKAFSRDNLLVYFVSDFASAFQLLHKKSSQHVDFSAVFLDWHLSLEDRFEQHDGVQLALLACDDNNQALKPAIYCISAENPEMRETLMELIGPGVDKNRIVLGNFMGVIDKILEMATDGSKGTA